MDGMNPSYTRFILERGTCSSVVLVHVGTWAVHCQQAPSCLHNSVTRTPKALGKQLQIAISIVFEPQVAAVSMLLHVHTRAAAGATGTGRQFCAG
jgi:hypothetical protein